MFPKIPIFKSMRMYFKSKLCDILYTIALAKRLEGTGVTANTLHPGIISTDLLQNFPLIINYVGTTLMRIFFKVSNTLQ